MKLIAVIPARGGSRSIPLKNIHVLEGKPLLAYTIEGAKQAGVADDIIVSTDMDEIANVAKQFGASIVKRPPHLAHDRATTESCLIHVLDTFQKQKGFLPECVLTLQPTSPLRTAQTIKKFVEYFASVKDQFDAMLSLTETFEDYWIGDTDGKVKRIFPNAARRRQERQPVYIENSALYITKSQALMDTGSIFGRSVTGFNIDPIEGIDINDQCDMQWAQFIKANIDKLPHKGCGYKV